MTVITN